VTTAILVNAILGVAVVGALLWLLADFGVNRDRRHRRRLHMRRSRRLTN
jgi:uncharacterized integral membrane protein